MIEHFDRYSAEYEALKNELRNFLVKYPEVPEDVSEKVNGIINEEFFDTTVLKVRLLDYHTASWSEDLLLTLLSLEGNEMFTNVARRNRKETK